MSGPESQKNMFDCIAKDSMCHAKSLFLDSFQRFSMYGGKGQILYQ